MKRYHCPKCLRSMEGDDAAIRANCFLCDVPMVEELAEPETTRTNH